MSEPKKIRTWIAERCYRARTTYLVEAETRKEAQAKASKGDCDGIDADYYDVGRIRVIREDRARG